MAQGMAEQQALLTRLVEEVYDCWGAVLEYISPYLLEERGIYRVDVERGDSSVLRAFLGDAAFELAGHGAVLDYLRQRAFPAPLVRRTRNGELLASYAGWTALLVSFIEGEVADFTPENLELLGSLAGSLHTLSYSALAETEQRGFPESRLRPTQSATRAIDNLTQALPDVPVALRHFYEDSLETLRRVQQAQQAGLLPETIIHGDCWPRNAVRTPERGLALIDWDCAGIGPAILDVGYLLLACHLGKPQLPTMQADEQCIAAVVRGYCQQRTPSSAELAILEDALLYDVARRLGLDGFSPALSDNWTQDIWLQKMLARYRVAPEIAAIAQRHFSRAVSS